MPDWIQLDPAKLNTKEQLTIHDVEIHVGLSPYDVPDAVRGHYDDDIQRFVIEFNYLGDGEELQSSWQNEHITLYVGKHTGCLYEIHVNVDDLRAEQVELKVCVEWIEDAIQHLGQDRRFTERRPHYEVANTVVSENARQLMPEMA